jgi:hypothetical protein
VSGTAPTQARRGRSLSGLVRGWTGIAVAIFAACGLLALAEVVLPGAWTGVAGAVILFTALIALAGNLVLDDRKSQAEQEPEADPEPEAAPPATWDPGRLVGLDSPFWGVAGIYVIVGGVVLGTLAVLGVDDLGRWAMRLALPLLIVVYVLHSEWVRSVVGFFHQFWRGWRRAA